MLLDALRCAIRGESLPLNKLSMAECWEIYRLSAEHHVLPLVVNAACEGNANDEKTPGIKEQAKQLVISQAQHTADFLLLLRTLERQELRPAVVKGLVCRSLYPEPELRPSVDEDLLIRPEEYDRYRKALAKAGFCAEKGSEGEDYEIVYLHPDSHLCIELHTSLFPADSDSYGSCAGFFEEALDHTINLEIGGMRVKTLSPTDHLLFLICHAYKHFLHGGVGIRQICDMALMAETFDGQIDWAYIRRSCDELNISVFTAAMFRICEKHLGFAMPDVFSEIEADESDLLEDILSGGLYGVIDIDRAHSSTMTLEAVSADRGNRRRKGALHAVFLPLASMRGQFPYLRKYPWLLPAAWTQRIFRYLARKDRPDPVNPARSVQIARERIELLREYRIIR